MYVIDGTNIKLTRGDSFYCEISMKNSSGETYEPQAGDVVRFYLKRSILNPPKSEYADRNPLISKLIPTITLKTPTMSARCSTTYMSTANAGLIDKTNTKLTYTCNVYRVRQDAYLQGFYRYLAARVAEMAS